MGIPLAQEAAQMQFQPSVSGFVALLIGILIFVFPRFLNYLIAAYLVFVGVVILFNLNI